MRGKARVAGLLATLGAAGAAAATLLPGDGGGPPSQQVPQPRIVSLQADPRPADEGRFVHFVASAEHPDGGALTYTWDFGDGESRTGTDLTSIEHRYAQDRMPYVVRLTVQGPSGGSDERTHKVQVRNVAPEITRVEREGPALRDQPVGFSAGASDPGLQDELTFQWDLGDGTTLTGASVEHTYREEGRHTVTLTVLDGDGGEDEATLAVLVGNGGSLGVNGDVTITETPSETIVATGAPGRFFPAGSDWPDHCFVTLTVALEGGHSMSLQGVLPDGLGESWYPVAASQEWAGQWEDETASPGVFYASLGLGEEHAREPGVNVPYWSLMGGLHVEHFDGSRLEASFEASLREQVPESARPGPRRVSAYGRIAQVLDREPTPAEVQEGAFYLCDVAERMSVATFEPEANAVNVDWEEPEIVVELSEEVDASSVDGNLQLDYRSGTTQAGPPGENRRTVPGTWMREPGDDHRVIFLPQAPLLDGVIYCVRVRAGMRGVRGVDGHYLGAVEPTFDETTGPACAGGSPWDETVEWGFATTPELENVRAAVYQVQRNAPLIPGKSTLTRVFWEWHPKSGIHPDAQVDSIPADVRVLSDGREVYARKIRRTLLRSDRYSREDTVFARNSLRFFGWRPRPGGSGPVRVVVEPSEQRRDPPREFEGETPGPIQREDDSPMLTFDYYFLRTGSWAEGVPETARRLGHSLVENGALYVTQNLPVVETRARFRGELDISQGWSADFDPVYQESWDLWQAASETSADAVVGLVPRDLHPNLAGTVKSRTGGVHPSIELGGARPLLLVVGRSNETTMAHEFGHFYGLCHPGASPTGQDGTPIPNACVQGAHDHEGFRILPGGRSGRNKDEGNEEASDLETLSPMMVQGLPAPGEVFVSRPHYQRLIHNTQLLGELGRVSSLDPPTDVRYASILPFSPSDRGAPLVPWPLSGNREGAAHGSEAGMLARRGSPEGSLQEDGRFVVAGVVDAGGATGEIRRVTVRRGEGRERARSLMRPTDMDVEADGTSSFNLRLLDGEGAELAATPIVPLRAWAPHAESDEPDGGLRVFSADVPRVEGAARVVVEHEGSILAERIRSSSPPEVSFRDPTAGAEVEGPTTVRWSATDPDGDSLTHALHYSPDGSEWRPVAIDLEESVHAVNAADLEPGPQPQLRVTVSDGFDEGQATLSLRLPRDLRPLVTRPEGSETVPLDEPVVVTFQSPVAAEGSVEEDPLLLRDDQGQPVLADLLVEAGGRRLILVPWNSLEPDTEYTVTLSAGLEDVHGRRVPDDVTWSFRTGSGLAAAPGPAALEDRSVPDEAPLAGDPVAAPPSGESASAPEGAASAAGRPSPTAADALGHGGTRWVEVRVEGHEELSFAGSQVDGAAGAEIGCTGDSRLILTVFDGPSLLENSRAFTIETTEVVSLETTGPVPVTRLLFIDRGGGGGWEGTGSLRVLEHEAPADYDRRRLSVVIEGELEGAGRGAGTPITIEASLNAACAPF